MGFISESRQRSNSSIGLTGLKGLGYSQTKDSQINELLSAAVQEGGAVSEVALELMNPQRSILATIGEGFKKSFTGFVDLIGTPGNLVAGAIDPTKTMSEAMKENLTVSDVIFGKSSDEKNRSAMSKTGEFVTRLAIDVLTDPLTYVTFGASRGVLGLSAASKLGATKKLTGAVGDILKATDQELTAKLLKAKPGLKQAELTSEISKIRKGAGQLKDLDEGDQFFLSVKGENLLNKSMIAQREGVLQSVTDKNIARSISETFKKSGKKLTDKELAARVAAVKAGTDKAMIETVLKGRLSQSFKRDAMANLLARNPALIETLVDKGGIKAFGKTILSGQRIKDSAFLIPGMKAVDKLTLPLRNKTMSLFDTSRTIDGRLPQEYVGLKQRSKDLAAAYRDDALNDILDVGRNLKLDEGEMDLVISALEGQKNPSNKKLSELWKALSNVEYDESIIPPRVFQATRFMEKRRTKNLEILRASGKKVTEQTDYVGHHLVKEKVKSIPIRPGIGIKQATAQKFAAVSTFVDEAGERLPGFAVKDGDRKLDVFLDKQGKDKLSLQRVDGEKFVDLDGQEFTRVRSRIEEAQNLGFNFEDDIYKVAALDSLDAIRTSVQTDFTREIAQKFGALASESPAGYRKVTIKGLENREIDFAQFIKGAGGEDILFHPAIAGDMEKFISGIIKDDASEGILKAYDGIQNMWKSSVTSIFPAFHGRNSLSNVFLNFMDLGVQALNPANHVQSAKIMVMNNRLGKLHSRMNLGENVADELFDLQNEVLFKDGLGTNWTFGELNKVIKDNVVGFNSNITTQVDITKTTGELVDDLGNIIGEKTINKIGRRANPYNKDFALFAGGRQVGSAVEDQARILNFVSNLTKTGDVTLSAQRTKQFLFDYQNLTNFERSFMRRVVPFYTFAKKNLALQAKTLMSTPGSISAEIRSIQTIGDVLAEERLSEEDKEKLPDWIRDSLTILKKNKNGQVEVIAGLGTPIEAAFGQLKPNQALGSVSPIIRLPVELMSGYTFFEGKSISDVTNAAAFVKAPKVLKDFIGYTEVTGTRKDGTEYKYHAALRPERMHLLLNLPPTSRVFSSMKQMQSANVSDQSKILQQIVGLKPFSFDLEKEGARREKELQKEMEKVLNTAGVGFEFNKFIIPEEDKLGGL